MTTPFDDPAARTARGRDMAASILDVAAEGTDCQLLVNHELELARERGDMADSHFVHGLVGYLLEHLVVLLTIIDFRGGGPPTESLAHARKWVEGLRNPDDDPPAP